MHALLRTSLARRLGTGQGNGDYLPENDSSLQNPDCDTAAVGFPAVL